MVNEHMNTGRDDFFLWYFRKNLKLKSTSTFERGFYFSDFATEIFLPNDPVFSNWVNIIRKIVNHNSF